MSDSAAAPFMMCCLVVKLAFRVQDITVSGVDVIAVLIAVVHKLDLIDRLAVFVILAELVAGDLRSGQTGVLQGSSLGVRCGDGGGRSAGVGRNRIVVVFAVICCNLTGGSVDVCLLYTSPSPRD